MNETTEFLKDTEQQTPPVDILEAPLHPEGQEQQQTQQPPEGEETTTPPEEGTEGTPKGEETEEGGEAIVQKPRNRRERRLQARLQAERQSSMQLAERLQTLSGAQASIETADYLKGIEQIYGTDTPEAKMATDLLKNAIVGMGKDAEERAYNRIAQERQQAQQQEQEAKAELDGFIDEIEDTYGVELSETQEKSYFQLLYKMSPKDSNGNVTGYADPHAVWEVFKERTTKKTPTAPKAKKLANRSMNQGVTQENSTVQEDSTVRFLKDNGII